MSLQIPDFDLPWHQRLRARLGPRLTALIVALAVETLLLIVLLTLGSGISEPEQPEVMMSSFDVRPPAEKVTEQDTKDPEPAKKNVEKPQPKAETPAPSPPRPATPQVAKINPAPTPPIQLPSDQMIRSDITPSPAPTKKIGVRMGPSMGPAAPAASGPPDTAVVGTAPNGEPLYAASWYREPTDDELSGYLSTAQGPGWGLIACRTVADYRVEDCVPVGEYPQGSNIARAVLAAAWQFKVRPPRIGGKLQVGSWVRIRIDYSIRRR
ncbi:hypothetical protein GRI39_08245 [Altererythrobacter indicus]|uniref:Energy transducer TonB n=1 Tax=Altericroceibacterium indicum TaxID=374177 RepID=A0A845AAJ2_9SPHN|nr:hypothetical protein [Altericroceibacterium indicum]MXP26031.1 hypothetical protein [Altericroceibacterium indicum]